MLDTLEGIGENNSELPELDFYRALAERGWNEKGSRNSDENRGGGRFGATAGGKKAGNWLVEASSIAEETLVSSSLHV